VILRTSGLKADSTVWRLSSIFVPVVVGWAFSSKPDAGLVIKALEMDYKQRGRPQNVLFHRDKVANTAARVSVRDYGVTASYRA
jgi:transposase InsO family protein